MNVFVVTISCCMLLQQPAQPDPFRPRVVPSPSPPLAIDVNGPSADSGSAPNDPPTEEAAPGTLEPGVPDPSAPADGVPTPEPSAASRLRDPTGESNPARPDDASPESHLAPVGGVRRQRLRPPELLAQALATLHEDGLQGEPLQLVTALSRSTDRQQQLRIAQAYWRLSAAQAAYHWALEERGLIDRHTQPHGDSLAVQSARSAAAANVRDAQLSVAQAQQEMAALTGTAGGEMPLSVDRPHVGSYSTLYQQIFGARPAPPRIQLIHRTLPIRRQTINAHAAAIVATLDAVEATGEQFETTGRGLATLLSLLAQLHRERQAFIAAVRQYNVQIAEYLLTVARPGTSDQVLVSRLILSTGHSDSPPAATQPSGTSQTQPPASNTTFPPAATPAPPAVAPAPQPTDAPAQPAANGGGLEPQTSNYQPSDVDDLMGNGGGLYRGLVDLTPPARVQKLSELLHWDRALTPESGQQMSLPDCLRNVSQGERPELLAAYWQAREDVARFQVLNDRLEELDALATALVALRNEPGIAEAGVRLQAARRIAKAATLEAQGTLLDAQFRLTQAARRPLEQPWLLPTTPPQSGRYVVAKHDPGALRRRADVVLLRYAELEERANAVIHADALRASLGNTAAATSETAALVDNATDDLSSLDRVMWAIERQSDVTLAFLENLTKYNVAIAHYALATAPRGILGDELVKRLVIARTARGDS